MGGGGVQGVGGDWGITPPTAFFVRNKKTSLPKIVSYIHVREWLEDITVAERSQDDTEVHSLLKRTEIAVSA